MSSFLDPSTLSDREAVADAVLRFAEGLDDGDADLLGSALLTEAVVDMSRVSETVGVMHGRAVVAEKLIGNLGKLDTTHHVSNFRIVVSGSTAELTCYALAQHFRPGEGRAQDREKAYMLRGNRYRAYLERAEDWWRIRTLTIDGVWVLGDINLVTGPS